MISTKGFTIKAAKSLQLCLRFGIANNVAACDRGIMGPKRLANFVNAVIRPRGVVSVSEYLKGQLICALLIEANGSVDAETFERFMQKADELETSIYERLRVEAVQYDWQGVNEAWLRAEAFEEMKKSLSDLPVFSHP